MAGQETIRDVVIRVAIKQLEAQFQTPQFEQAAQKRAAAEKKAMDDVVQHAKASYTPHMRAAMSNPNIQAIKDIDARMKAEQQVANELAKDQLREITMAEKIAAHRREKAAEAVSHAQKQEAANIKAAQAARSLGESATTAARGLIMLNASGNKEVEKVVQSLLVAQGLVDVYKGLTGVLVGVAQAYRAIAASAAAAAAAQSASAAAAGGRIAGGAASLAGMGVGAAGLGLTGLVGGVGFGIGAAAGFGLNRLAARSGLIEDNGWNGNKPYDDLKKDNLAFQNQQDQADLARRQQSRKFANTQNVANLRMLTGFEASSRQRGFDESEARVGLSAAGAEVGRARTTAERQAAMAAQFGAGGNVRTLLAAQGRGITGEVAQAQTQLQAANAQLATVEQGKGGKGSNSDYQEDRKAALEQIQEAERNVASALERQTENRGKQLQAQRQQVELAKDQLQAEKDRVNTINQGLGGLNKGEQNQVRRLASKVKGGGELSEGELRFLEQNGGGAFSEFTSKERRKRGEAAFANDDISVLTGGGSKVKELESQLAQLIAGKDGSGPSVAKLLEQLGEDRKREVAALEKVVDSSKALGDVSVLLEQLRDNMEALNRREARRRAAEGG